MPSAKSILIKPITSQSANKIIKRYHYSGKVVNNSQLHFGVFLGDACYGAMSFGPSMDKNKVVGLVKGTRWNGFIELNRLAFSDILPRNSESRAISIALKIIRKKYSHIEWVLSYSDATACGDGTIYRASGFYLTNIGKNTTMIEMPWGERIASLCLSDTRRPMRLACAKRLGINVGAESSVKPFLDAGCKIAEGYQLRYIYFINKKAKQRLTVPIIPFSDIKKTGASMYKGVSGV